MDSLLLPLRLTSPAVSRHIVCVKSPRMTQAGSDAVWLSSSHSRVQTKMAASFKVWDQLQLRSRAGGRGLAAEAELTTDEGSVNEADLAVEEAEEEAATSDAQSDDAVTQSVALLKTAAKTRKVPASEIVAAFKVLNKAKLDPTDFLQLIGGPKSPGRTWLLVFTCNKEQYNSSEGKGSYLPITAVQNFDAEAMFIQNGVYLGRLGELTFSGNFMWEKRNLRFNFDTLKVKIGPFGPFGIPISRKDQEITKNSPGFIWSYVDDEILVGKGKAGGTAFWVRCERAKKSMY